MSNLNAQDCSVPSEIECAVKVMDDFEVQGESAEQNVGLSTSTPHQKRSSFDTISQSSHPLADVSPPNVKVKIGKVSIKTPEKISRATTPTSPLVDPLECSEGELDVPNYLTQEFAEKAPKYLPPFKKPQSQRPKPKTPSPSEEHKELVSEHPEQQKLAPEQSSRAEPANGRRSSRSERSQFVRQHCLDFQDYKRTVNNKQKGLEQSLNQVMPQMNSAMVDAQNLASKIEKVRNQDCPTEKDLKIQNDKMKYLVGRTVGTISKIDRLFDRFRTDILDYTTLTTEGNDGIDQRLGKLLKILCGMDDDELAKEKNLVIRDAFGGER